MFLPSAERKVLLIDMPFAFLFRPSLCLSLLKALLIERKIPTSIQYATLQFAELVGQNLYFNLANETPDQLPLAGEWLFSGALFDRTEEDTNAYVENVLRARSVSESFISDLLNAREKVERFIDGCVGRVRAEHPTIVGFTTSSQQQIPALALARRIKEAAPSTLIVFAGVDWDGIMAAEIVRRFPFVDVGVSGEPEIIVPELVERYCEGKSVDDLQGVYTADNLRGKRTYRSAPPVRDLDSLPFPDYDDFFEQLETSSVERDEEPRLQFETSRGCWWGQKRLCTFCGLVGDSTYRSKTAGRAMTELKYLIDRYRGRPVWTVDSILDMKYFRVFVPDPASATINVELSYKVESTLRKEHVLALRDAGITMIQPGMEKLSDPILGLMRKGSRRLQNIQILKWCKELGIKPFWNIIWGFPGEPADEYARMAQIIPAIAHLPPPQYAGPVSLERFSPNHDFAERFGFVDVLPHPAYRYIYPFNLETVTKLARHFVFDYRAPRDVGRYTELLSAEVVAWQKSSQESDLFSTDLGSRLLVWDLRPGAREPLTVLAGLRRVLYLACDTVRTRDELERLAADDPAQGACPRAIDEALEPLLARGLVIQDGESFLSLAIPLGAYSPSEPVQERFDELVEQIGRGTGDISLIQDAEPVRQYAAGSWG